MLCGIMEFLETRWTSCKQCSVDFCKLNLISWRSYVDEAQDNLLIDALGTFLFGMSFRSRPHFVPIPQVLRKLCRNPHGMFWAGDTAQTISVGSAFRFNDLKAFLYRVEEVCAMFTTQI